MSDSNVENLELKTNEELEQFTVDMLKLAKYWNREMVAQFAEQAMRFAERANLILRERRQRTRFEHPYR